jgi:uncharacterized protein YeaO (DUF488 family)
MTIFLKRVYEEPVAEDSRRILVERLWPRGLKKEDAKVNEWLKDLAPSGELRKWYSYDSSKWIEFKKQYWSELYNKKQMIEKIKAESKSNKITFLFGSKEKN